MHRYLVEAPPNICKPAYLADAAAEITQSAPEVLKLEVLEEEDCAKLGMGLYLGVSECSEAPPKFIHITYTPPGVIWAASDGQLKGGPRKAPKSCMMTVAVMCHPDALRLLGLHGGAFLAGCICTVRKLGSTCVCACVRHS